MKDTKVISVFPACGKTYVFKNFKNKVILDSGSSKFSWIQLNYNWNRAIVSNQNKVRNPDFPQNYIDHIKENIGKADYIFVSSHKEVRRALD